MSSSTMGLVSSGNGVGRLCLELRPNARFEGSAESSSVSMKVDVDTFDLVIEVSKKAFIASIRPFCSLDNYSTGSLLIALSIKGRVPVIISSRES